MKPSVLDLRQARIWQESSKVPSYLYALISLATLRASTLQSYSRSYGQLGYEKIKCYHMKLPHSAHC